MPEKESDINEIKKKLANIEDKLIQVISLQTRQLSQTSTMPSSLKSLPEHLRKTAVAVATMNEATAEEISRATGRTRAAESDYLNQLVGRGFLRKERKGRKIRFRVFALYTKCPFCLASVLVTLDHCALCGAPLSKETQPTAARIS